MTTLVSVACLALGMTVPLSGTVVDAADRPVAGATVWLGDTFATRQGPEVLAATETDDQGRFRLERADDLVGRGGYWSPTLWVYQPGFRVAFIEYKGKLPGADEPVRIALGPPTATALRVFQPDGKPAREARVRLVWLTIKAPRPPDKMLDRLATTTDADGRAQLDGFAPTEIFGLDVTAQGQLVQCLPIDADTGAVTLRPLGRLKARIVADDPKVLAGWKITATSRPAEPGYRGPNTHWVRETTGADGRVEFQPIAEGRISWDIKAPEGSNYLVDQAPAAMIREGGLEEVEIAVRRGVRVEGAVREEPGGAPVPGIKVDVASLRSGSRTVEWLVTDAQGRFSAVVLPGKVRFSFSLHDVPKDYFLPPKVQSWADFDVEEGKERHEFNPPPLWKGARVRGRVVDDAGKPVVGVEVTGAWTSAEFGLNPNRVRAQTDLRGEFALGNIAPKADVLAWATLRSGAETDPVNIPRAGEGEPITIHLQKRPEGKTLALSGRVVAADGQPLAGALVRVKYRPANDRALNERDFGFDGTEEIRTGPDGRYRTPAQLPIENEYRVETEAPGYEPSRSLWLSAMATEVPNVTLRRSVGTRPVTGRVVDSAGKPVAGAEVFQSGDGPRKTRGATDDAGKFQVPGVPNALAFLFVSKAGYRFLGRRVNPADHSVEFTVRRIDEPPASPLRRNAAAPVPRDEERALARALIAEARKAPGDDARIPEQMKLPEIAALLDPDRAIEMIENQVVSAEPALLTAVALGRFEGDPRKALEFLDAIAAPHLAATVALRLFDRLGTTARPEFRRALLERAEQRARAIEEPGQAASAFARIADRRLDLGDADQGAALVRKAQALAEKPREQPFPDPRDDLAPALARVDLPAALKLLEGRDPRQSGVDLRAGIARRIAAANPAEARRILGMIPHERWSSERFAACLRLALKDLPAAREQAARDHDPMVEALLPAMAAKARAESDPAGARALLLEAVERLGKLRDDPKGGPSPSLALARLLPLAARIDPDRAPEYFWLALSRRPPLSARPEPMPVLPDVRKHYLHLIELAILLAPYDLEAAEAVFAPVAARLVGLDDERWGLGNDGPALFRAAGAFDARVAKTLLDALPEDPPPPVGQPRVIVPNFRHHTKAQARIALAEVLALPPALRLGPFEIQIGGDSLEDLDD